MQALLEDCWRSGIAPASPLAAVPLILEFSPLDQPAHMPSTRHARQVGLASLQGEVVMIVHQAVGMGQDVETRHGLGDDLEEATAVAVILVSARGGHRDVTWYRPSGSSMRRGRDIEPT